LLNRVRVDGSKRFGVAVGPSVCSEVKICCDMNEHVGATELGGPAPQFVIDRPMANAVGDEDLAAPRV
jgi:hypothetical protein